MFGMDDKEENMELLRRLWSYSKELTKENLVKSGNFHATKVLVRSLRKYRHIFHFSDVHIATIVGRMTINVSLLDMDEPEQVAMFDEICDGYARFIVTMANEFHKECVVTNGDLRAIQTGVETATAYILECARDFKLNYHRN